MGRLPQNDSPQPRTGPKAPLNADLQHRSLRPEIVCATQRAAAAAALQRTVVVASADASFRQRLSKSLTDLRWRVREAGGGAEALAHLDDAAAEALLLDAWLPDLEVVEFARQLQQVYPEIDLVQIGGDPESSASRSSRAQGSQSGSTSVGGPPTISNSSAPARSPRRNELLHAIRVAQEEVVPQDANVAPRKGGFDQAAWNAAPISIPGSRGAVSLAAGGADAAVQMRRQHDLFAAKCATFAEGGMQTGWVDLPLHLPRPDISETSPSGGKDAATPMPAPDTVLIPEMVGESAAMRKMARLVRLVAPRSTTVLLEGATGTGKEVVARALYRLSTRSSKPFTVLNCAAIPEALLEAELFGHTRGAFTGAVQSRTGRIEAAHGGTLFLDEIGEMPLGLQAKLLRFLECGELQRVGENEPVRVDVRVIAATHQPLEQRSKEGRFRSDLYYRLAVFPMHVPSLAERMEDVPLLAAHFLAKLGEQAPVKRLAEAAMRKLIGYAWPGNVRELAHVLERATILADNRPEIQPEDICFGSGPA